MDLLNGLKDGLQDVGNISNTIGNIADDASPETEEEIEHDEKDKKSKMEKLVERKKKEEQRQVIGEIISALDTQNWEEAQKLMDKEIKNKEEFIKAYIKLRFLRGQEKLSEVKKGMTQISSMTNKGAKAVQNGDATEAVVKTSMIEGLVQSINEGMMLDAQRKITQGAKAAEAFNYKSEHLNSKEMVEIAKKDVDDIQKLDEKMGELTKQFGLVRNKARELASEKGIPFSP